MLLLLVPGVGMGAGGVVAPVGTPVRLLTGLGQ